MKKQVLVVLFLFPPIVLLCQVEKDSTGFGLDSLLEKNVKRTEYVKSASKYSQTVYESPNSLNLLTEKTLQTYGYKNLSEALSNVDALYLTNDLNYQYLGISGFGRPTEYNNRVQLLFDGHRLNDYVYNAIPIDELAIDLSIFDGIEVIKGPGSVLYGGNAMFGVINLLPQKATNTFSPKLRVTRGSFNTVSVSGLLGYEFESGLSINLHGYNYTSDGRDYYFSEYDTEENNNGIVKNMDSEKKQGIYASIKYGNFELFGVSSYRSKDVPTAPFGVDFGSKVETSDLYNFWEGRYSSNLGFDKHLTLRFYYDQYKYSGLYIYDASPTWDANDSRSIGAEAQFLWDPVPYDRIIIGTEISRAFKAEYKYWDDTQIFTEFNAPVNIYSFFLQNEYHYNNQLTFYIAARLDSYQDSDTKLSPRGTIIYSPNDKNTFRMLIGSSFRIPSAYEKYYSDLLSGFKINEELKPEQITSYELNWNLRLSHSLSLDVSAYKNQISSFVELAIDPADSLQYYSNLAGINSYGMGAGIRFDATDKVGGYMTVQLQDSRDANNAKLVISPDNLIKFGFYYKIWKYLKIGFEHRFESSKLSVYGSMVPAVNYSSLNIYTPEKFIGFDISLTVKNLFNNSIESPGDLQHKQATFPMPGRNYALTVGYEL